MEETSPIKGQRKVELGPSSTPKQFHWTYEMECHFLELLQNQDQMGNRVGGAFTTQAYRNILFDMQSTYGTLIQKNHLKNKIRSLKQNYSEFKDAFRGMSGFAWNWETKTFDAEDDVWEALVQENPYAACLRSKCCYHWDQMNSLGASSRAMGNKAATGVEHSSRPNQHWSPDSYETPFQSTHCPRNSGIRDFSPSPNLPFDTLGSFVPEFSGSGPSMSAGKSKGKRKASDELSLQSVAKNLSSSIEQISRAIVESADIISNKRVRLYDDSAHLFKAVEELDMAQENMLACYEYLSKNEKDSNMFLCASYKYRKAMLMRIMHAHNL